MLRGKLVFGVCLATLAAACGSNTYENRRPKRPPAETEDSKPPMPFDPAERYVVRARTKIEVNQKSAAPLLLTLTKGSASSSTGISGTVVPAVAFEVSEDHFENPSNPTDEEVSYGSLDISTLRDNSLSVCGNGGNQK